jgi:hypothetical protein
MNSSLHVPTRLGALILLAEAIVVAATIRTVDQDARIRATVASGEAIVAALRAYERDRGTMPVALAELVPQYLAAIPEADYGTTTWVFDPAAGRAPTSADRALAVDLPLGRSNDADQSPSSHGHPISISVLLDRTNPAQRLARDAGGCWRLPELPTCW